MNYHVFLTSNENIFIYFHYLCLFNFSAPPTPPSTSNGRLIAKYNYKANPNQPGGFVEMSLTAGEKLHFVGPHCVNPYWWEARKESGESAFVPATYVMVWKCFSL